MSGGSCYIWQNPRLWHQLNSVISLQCSALTPSLSKMFSQMASLLRICHFFRHPSLDIATRCKKNISFQKGAHAEDWLISLTYACHDCGPSLWLNLIFDRPLFFSYTVKHIVIFVPGTFSIYIYFMIFYLFNLFWFFTYRKLSFCLNLMDLNKFISLIRFSNFQRNNWR